VATKRMESPTSEPSLPANKSAEDSVIGGCLLSPNEIDEVSFLRPEMFWQVDAGVVWACLSEMRRQGKPIDTELVAAELSATGKLSDAGGAPRLLKWMETVPHTAHTKHYAGLVSECWRRRSAIQAATDIITAAHDPTESLDEMLLAAESRLHQVMESRRQTTSVELSDVLLDCLAALESEHKPGAMIGFHGLDQILGGFKPGQLVIIAARPAMGKTAFVGQVSVQLAETGTPVLFVSIEMMKIEITERMLSGSSSIPMHRLTRRELRDGDRQRILDAAQYLSKLPIVIDDESDTLSSIAAAVRLTKRRHGIKVVIVDYLQLMRPEGRAANREQEVATMSRGLKRIAKQNEVAVVALAQLNRAIEGRPNKEPQLADLRESGAIEQDADVVMFLHRPGYYDPQEDPSKAVVMVKKQRNGPIGKCDMEWRDETLRFIESGGFA
jgi:replicative DNA helicase